MKLYKFRPLRDKDEDDFKNIKDILTKRKFWCSRFFELNDPMEGIFFTDEPDIISTAFNDKNEYVICSFSNVWAFKRPSIWGYYANGFKGVAIEVEVEKSTVTEITYSNEIQKLCKENIKSLLLTKLKCWKHEHEYRYLIKSSEKEHCIGMIRAVYCGNPFGDSSTKNEIYKTCKELKAYEDKINKLEDLNKDIPFYNTKIEDNKVIKGEPWNRQLSFE